MGNENLLQSKSEANPEEEFGGGFQEAEQPKPKKSTVSEDDLTRLPKVRNYQPQKVRDLTDNKDYAMKFFCLEVKESYLSEEEQKEMIQSGLKELDLLKQVNETRNIIHFKESFVVERSPLNDTSGRHLCLIIEYCRGGNLNNLISDYEKRKKKIRREYVFRWFLDLLSTLNVLHHTYNVIHRDLKPDNLLFQMEREKKNFELEEVQDIKVCDFGVGKVINNGNMGQQIRGHLFYTAPEVLKPTLSKDVMKSRGYDSRCDIYSLGIIFFQLYKCLSQDRYEKIIVDLQNRMLTPKKRIDEKKDETINYFELMIRAHRHGVIRELVKQNVGDEGVRQVLYKMLAPYEKRSYSKGLLQNPIIKTWMNCLALKKPVNPNVDVVGLLSIFKVMGRADIYERCFLMLKKVVPAKCSFEKFVEMKGVRTIMKTLGSQPKSKQGYFFRQFVFKLLMAIFQKVPSTKLYAVVRKVGVYLRRYELVEMFKAIVGKDNRNDLYFFLCLLFRTSQSLIFEFIDVVVGKIMPKMSKANGEYVAKLLEFVTPFLNKKEVEKVLRSYTYPDLKLFRRMPFKNERVVNEMIFGRIWRDLSSPTLPPPKAGRLLELLAYCTFDFGQYAYHKSSNLKLMFSCQPTPDCGLEFVIPEQKNKGNLVIDPKVSTRYFHYKGGEKKHDHVELMSSEPICKMTFTSDQEVVIGYFEFYVKNAGNNDDLLLGLQDERDKEIILHCAKGIVSYEKRIFRLGTPITAVTKMMVGMGVTSKGNVFITKNNDVVKIIPTFNPRKDKDVFLFALLKIKKGNKDLKGYVNFGKRMFLFTFNNFKKNNKLIVVNSLNELKGNTAAIQEVKKKFQNNQKITKLCQSLLNFRSFKISQFPDLLKRYDLVDMVSISKKHRVNWKGFHQAK